MRQNSYVYIRNKPSGNFRFLLKTKKQSSDNIEQVGCHRLTALSKKAYLCEASSDFRVLCEI